MSGSDLRAVVNELPKHIELTRNKVGCLVFEVLQDKEYKSRFSIYEKISSRSAFELHQ